MSNLSHLPRAILFDLDDTIIRAYGKPGDAWAAVVPEFANELGDLPVAELVQLLSEAGGVFWRRVAEEDAAKHWRLNLPGARRIIVRTVLEDKGLYGTNGLDEAFANRLADRFTAFRTEEMHLFPGAIEAIDTIKAAGVKLALITNGDGPTQRAKVERFGLEHRFDHIQIEGEHGVGKPEDAAYFHALDVLGTKPNDTWMVGDNLEWEVATPQRLGIFAIWHDAYGTGLPDDPPAKPDWIIRSLTDLLNPKV